MEAIFLATFLIKNGLGHVVEKGEALRVDLLVRRFVATGSTNISSCLPDDALASHFVLQEQLFRVDLDISATAPG